MQAPANTKSASDAANFDSVLNVMFLAAFPLLLWVFSGSFSGVATAVMQIWLFSLALRLISRGQKAHDAYDAAEIAARPRLPLKLIGSGLIGVLVVLLAGHTFDNLLLPFAMGLGATGLAIAAFGIDPLKDKGLDNPDVIARMEQDALLDEIEHKLAIAADQVAALEDPEVIRRTEVAREMILRMLTDATQQPESFATIRKPVQTFATMLSAEVLRLLASAEGPEFDYARRRYMAKLQVMTGSFRKHARKKGFQVGRDAFEREADNLLTRMPRESAA